MRGATTKRKRRRGGRATSSCRLCCSLLLTAAGALGFAPTPPLGRGRLLLAPLGLHEEIFETFRPSSLVKNAKGDMRIGLPEEADMPAVASLFADSFSVEVIMASSDWSRVEKNVFEMPVNLYNSYMKGVSYYEVLFGTKARVGNRLQKPSLKADFNDVLLLAILDKEGGEAAAAVELQLRVADGSLPNSLEGAVPFIGSKSKEGTPEPYLCNLCVRENLRGQGIGKRLMWLAERIVHDEWGYNLLYLHVDPDDPVASKLYRTLGYREVEMGETGEKMKLPRWLTGEPNVRLLRKELRTSKD